MEIEEGTPVFKQDRRLKRWEGGFMQRRVTACCCAGSSPRIRGREFLSTYNMRGDDDGFECVYPYFAG